MDNDVLCTFGPPKERRRHWILKFEDTDRDDMHFDDEGQAMRMFVHCADNWTCTLFVTASYNPLDQDRADAHRYFQNNEG